MHLKSLELTGFKSFAEAKIEFPKGVTTVVGPNGTGKSNVVDAILWVLGEQSTKTLRSERMEDVIFNGTETRKPLGMAEVSLIMSGFSDQKLDGVPALPNQLGEYHEVMITRRLYRNGDSEYLINKTPCRLKDIRSLFLDTRAGSKGHTVIEQGRIDLILNASPQDRRELIEETAGIVRYKKQKAEALRKLDSTHQNLLRVRDIIAEVRRQLNSLERQARQARAYQNLQQEARTLEIRLLVRNYRALLGGQTTVDAELATLDMKESGHAAEQARLTCHLEEVRLKMLGGDEAVSRLREEVARIERQQAQALTTVEVEGGRLTLYEQQRVQAVEELARLGREHAQAASDIADLRTRLSQTDAEIVTGERSFAELEKTVQELAARRAAAAEEENRARRGILDITVQVTSGENSLAGLESRRAEALRRAERLVAEQTEIEGQRAGACDRLQGIVRSREDGERYLRELQREREEASKEAQRLDDRLRETDQIVGRQQEELAGVESRLRALQGVVREDMGYGREGEEKATSLRAACAGVREAVAEWLVVPPEFERAIEAVLGERVRAWLVDGPSEARQAIEFLKKKKLGRGTFLPLRPRWSADADGRQGNGKGWWPALADERGVLGQALDLVRAPDKSKQALACLFEGVVVVKTLDVAVRLWERGLWSAPGGPTLVTLEGEVLDAAGVLTGGANGESGGLLQRRREIEQLEAKRAALTHTVEENRRNREQLSAERESGAVAGPRRDEAIREAEMGMLAFTKDEAGLGQSVEGLDRRLDTIRAERLIDEEERTRIDGEIEAARTGLARMRQQKADREAGLAELSKGLIGMEEESLALQHRVTDSRLSVAALRARREHGGADLARLIKEQDERAARVGALDQQIDSLAAATRRSENERERNEALFQKLERHAVRIRTELVSAQEAQARDSETARKVERELASVREALTSSREARTAVEVRRAEIRTQLATLEGTLTGTYQLSVEAALAQEPRGEDEKEVGESGQSDEISLGLRDQLQKIRDRLERMGAINLASIEEHQALDERHRFLTTQEEDLTNSVRALKEIINRINRTTKQMFMDTFNELQQKFGEVFARFFQGGRAELVLTEPQEGEEQEPGSGGEPGVDIVAQPPGKRLKNIAMLSGGEKTLTAMALIFASFLIRPTPFCVLDEIDAPLDEENIGRFTEVLRELAEEAQFIVITHNKRTMAVADSLFGVTMEEPGISKLVSVRLVDLQPA
jgi:chromosome segregation protein